MTLIWSWGRFPHVWRNASGFVDLSVQTERPRYYLTEHAFSCVVDSHYVFLDLKSDEYLCLGREQSREIHELLNTHGDSASHLRESARVTENLLAHGLVTKDGSTGKVLASPSVDIASASLLEHVERPQPRFQALHVLCFTAAAASASIDLRWRSIHRTVRSVRNFKATHAASGADPDIEGLSGLFEIFRLLRPYYPRAYLCLFDSLALVRFLARFGVFPQWVYGVRLEPFGAHCWVQSGNVVVNDVVDNVGRYTPIMSV